MNAKQITGANKRAQNDAAMVKAAATNAALFVRDQAAKLGRGAKKGAKEGASIVVETKDYVAPRVALGAKIAVAYIGGFVGTIFARGDKE